MKHRILLVEDDECVGLVLIEVMVRSGYKATLADGLSAVKKMKHFDFSAVIADFRLSDGDACDVIEFLRSKIPGVPAIVISGDGNQAAIDCADRRLSDVSFVNKPFLPQDLLDRLKALLMTKTNPQGISGAPRAPSANPFGAAAPRSK
jgi:DNA-binding response OmpR family regulator